MKIGIKNIRTKQSPHIVRKTDPTQLVQTSQQTNTWKQPPLGKGENKESDSTAAAIYNLKCPVFKMSNKTKKITRHTKKECVTHTQEKRAINRNYLCKGSDVKLSKTSKSSYNK